MVTVTQLVNNSQADERVLSLGKLFTVNDLLDFTILPFGGSVELNIRKYYKSDSRNADPTDIDIVAFRGSTQSDCRKNNTAIPYKHHLFIPPSRICYKFIF